MEVKKKESQEKKIPVFTVFKKGVMLKNIFLLDKATSPLLIPSPKSLNSDDTPNSDEEVLLVGRHPECSIVLEHPSISRFHLQIRLQPSLHKLSLVDLSSAHGTWVSDRKIEPQIRVELSQGDTLRLGASTRTYTLHWVSLTSVLDPLVSHNLETLVPPEVKQEEGFSATENMNSAEQHLSPLSCVFDDQGLLNSVSHLSEQGGVLESPTRILSEHRLRPSSPVVDVENPLVFSNSETLVVPEVKEYEEGVFDNEYLNSAEQHLSPLNHLSGDQHSPALSNFETPLPSEEIEEGGLLENQSPNLSDQHLYPLGCVYAVENSVVPLNTKTLVSPQVKEEEGLSENENLNQAEQHLSSLDHVFDDENILGLSNFEKDLPPEEIEEVCASENKNPDLSEQHLSPHGHVFDAKNQLVLQQSLSGTLHSGDTLGFLNLESSVPPEEVVEGMLDNQVLIASDQYLYPLSCVFDVESPIVSPNSENTLPTEEKEVKDVLTNEFLIPFGRHVTPSAPPLMNFTEDMLSPSSICVEELGSESTSSSSSLNNFTDSVESVADYRESPQHRLEKESSTPPLWSRRGKPPSLIRIAIASSKGKTMEVIRDDENKSDNQNKIEDESATKVLFSSYDTEEEFISANNENHTPKREVGSESVEMRKSGEVELRWSYGSLSSTRSEDKGMSTLSEKENLTPIVSHDSRLQKPLSESRLGKEADMITSKRMEGRMPFQCLVVNSVEKTKSEASVPVTDAKTNVYVNCDQDELTPKVLFACSDGDEDIFTPYKVICHPEAGLGSQSKDEGRNAELELEKSYGLLTSSNIEEKIIPTFLGKENPTEVAVPITSTTCCKSVPNFDTQSYQNANKRWYMVVDSNCLLNKESRRSLQLLQGLKGTQVIIPRTVLRELDCLQKRCSLLKKTTKASSALEWIEDCTLNSKFWIHIQGSIEEPIAPMPVASPRWLSWLSGEVCSPTAEDCVLDCALLFKRIKKDDGYVVLLSDDITLKTKAMAEGVLCETASEFRESLVNPYSERFLWAGSSPRGPTWCCLEEPGLRENCCNVPVKKIIFKTAEGANKGLKLLLFPNYLNSGQMISVS